MKSSILFVVVIACFAPLFGAPLAEGPFAGINLADVSPEIARAVREASADFALVCSGEMPRYAVFYELDVHTPDDPRRDHFLRFRGFHYTVLVSKVPVNVGGQEGIIFGPRVVFFQDLFPGWLPELENTRFIVRRKCAELLRGDGLGGRWRLVPPPFDWPKRK